MGNLKSALLWSALERIGLQGVQFFLSIILARLLNPEEFGLIGMISIFYSLAYSFADSGLSIALVQRENNSADDEATVFYANVAAGLGLTILLCGISPFVAKFYGQPILLPLLCVLSLQIFISSFGIIQFTLLMRAMDFRKQAVVSIVSLIISGSVGIYMALNGYGVWSLVGQSLTGTLATTLIIWKIGRWRLKGRFRLASFREMWPFSSRVLASGVLNKFFEDFYNVVIGRLYQPADLGYFIRGRSLAQLPALIVTTIFGRITLPVFARMQNDLNLLKDKVRKVFRILAAAHFPAMTGLAIVADPFVRVLLTDKWAPCVPYLQILAFAGMLYPLHALHLNVLLARGRSDLFLRLEIIKKVLTVVTLLATFRFGVLAMVAGMLVFSIFCLSVNGYYTRSVLHYHWLEQALDLAPVCAAVMVMAIAMVLIQWSLHGTNALTLLLGQIAGGLVVYGLIAGFSRFRAFLELRSEIFVFLKLGSGKPGQEAV